MVVDLCSCVVMKLWSDGVIGLVCYVVMEVVLDDGGMKLWS